MAPIRIALIGLSTTSKSTSWASHAHLPYLQSPQGQKHYKIVALCNSSVDSANKSIEEFKLGSDVKAYSSAEELAHDPDVDLVVNVTGVERHYELVLPLIKAGKNVFTELPLASNMKQMTELYETAKSKDVKTVFGMQGQTSSVTKVLREVIASGKIGKVLSTTWVGYNAMGFLGEKPLPQGMKGFVDREVGANLMTVWFLHTFNHILAVLGELSSYTSLLGNQRPSVQLMDPKTKKVVETVTKNTPDHIMLQGRLESGATVSYHLRGGDQFPSEPGVRWYIYGEKGEIRITNPSGCTIDIVHKGVEIKLHVFGQDPVDVELPDDELKDVEHPAQNVGRIYEAYAEGREGGEGGYPNWEEGFKRHKLMEEMFVENGF